MPTSQPATTPLNGPARWLTAMRGNRLLWLTSGLILVAAVVAVLLLLVERERTLAAGERTTNAFATVVDEQISRTIQTIDQRLQLVTLTLIGMQAAGEPDPQAVRAMLRQQITSLPFVRAIWTLDKQGHVRYNWTESQVGLDLSDRDYFTVYRTRPGSGFFLGDPVQSRTAGRALVSASRPLTDRDGNFAGVVVVAIEPEYFDRLWRSMAFDTSGSVALLRTDGTMLLRSPWNDTTSVGDQASTPLITQHLPAHASGSFMSERLVDGGGSFYAYRTLAERPDLVIMVGRSLRAILAPWRSLAWLILVLWAVGSLLATALAVYFRHLSGQRSLAEQRRAQAAHRLSLAADATNIVVWDWDPRSDRFWATPTHYTSLGYAAPDDQVDLAQWRTLVHEDDRARVYALVDSMRSHPHVPFDYDVRLRHADGSYRWCHVSGRSIESGPDGNAIRLMGVRVDMTERRKAEFERQQIFNRITDGFIALDLQWRFIYANKQAGELLGRDPDSLIGRDIWTTFPPRPQETFHLVCRQAMQDQKPSRLEAFYPEFGRWIEDHIYPSPQGLSIYFRDITQRKLDEEALRDSKEYAENLIAGANAMIVGLDMDGHVTLFNAAAQRLTGYTLADFENQHWFERLVPRHRFPQVWELLERLAEGGLPEHFETPILTRSGEERLIAWQSSVSYQGGVISGSLSFGVDVTEQRRGALAVAKSSQRMRDLIDGLSATMLIALTTPDGRLVESNSALREASGRTWNQLDGMAIDSLPGFTGLESNRLALRGAVARGATGEPSRFDVLLSPAGGASSLTLDVSSAALRDEQGQVLHIVFAGIDVTERRRAEGALRDSQEMFHALTDHSMQGVVLTQEGAVTYANPAQEYITGYSLDEARQKTAVQVFESIHPDDRAMALERQQRTLRGEPVSEFVELRCRHKRGDYRWLQMSSKSFTLGNAPVRLSMMIDITDRKLAELALLESETRFRSAFDSSGVGMALTALDGQWLRVNPALCEIVGRSADEMRQYTFMDLTYPADLAADLAHMDHLLAGRIPRFQMEKRYVHKDGHTVWVNLTVALVRDSDGRPLHTVAQMEDIRQSKKLEAALHASQADLATTLDTLPDLLFEVDIEGRYLAYHSPRTDLLIAPPDKLIGQLVSDVMSPAAAATILAALQEALTTGRSGGQQIELETPTGRHWFELTMARKPQLAGERPRFVVLSRDISERVEALELLRTSEERYRSLVQWTPLGIAVHQDGLIVYANPACMAILGASSESDLLGRPIRDFMQAPDHAELGAGFASVPTGQDMAMALRKYARLDGSLIDIEGKAAPIIFNGAPAVQFSMRDVTTEKAAEAASLSSRQQLRALSARVLGAQEAERGRVAHELHDELGQSLTALKINLQAQGNARGNAPKHLQAENIRIVEQTLQHVRALALALRPSMLDDLGLLPALRWLIDHEATRHALAVVFRAPARLDRLSPDLETAVFRIVQEALTNVVRHAKASEVGVALVVEGDTLRIDIHDNGVGFDRVAMLRRVAEGASVGVLGMVERAGLVGATLDIHSEPGNGTSISLVCPIGAAAG